MNFEELMSFVYQDFLYEEMKSAEAAFELFQHNCRITGDWIDGISHQQLKLKEITNDRKFMFFAVKFIVVKLKKGETFNSAFFALFEKFPSFIMRYKTYLHNLLDK